MKHHSLKTPAIILALGLILCILASLFTCILKAPRITQQDFPYSVTYTLDGETRTFEGLYSCRFVSTGQGTDPLERHYEGTYLTLTSEYHPAAYTVAQKDDLELCIVTGFSNDYLMGEPDFGYSREPYLAVMDAEGYEYEDAETLSIFHAEIVSWVMPEPVENSFSFAGFSHLHDSSMFAMLAVGILVILACMIFVKRDQTVSYKTLDKVSIVLNVLVVFVVLPVAAIIVYFTQIVASGPEFSYQLLLCLPVFTAYTVAASICLRRKGFTRAGFFIQLITPAFFGLLMIQ